MTTDKPNSSPCSDPDDVIAEEQSRHSFPSQWVARCCHGTTSQGDSRAHAITMTLEACALAHDADPPASNRTLDITLNNTTWAELERQSVVQGKGISEMIEDMIVSTLNDEEPDPSIPPVRKFA